MKNWRNARNDIEWGDVRSFIADVLNTDESIIDYIAVFDILKLCAEGYSVPRIALTLDEDLEYVQDVLKEFYNFDGYGLDLDFNSLYLYNKYKFNEYTFVSSALSLTKLNSELEIKTAFRINKKFFEIQRKVEEFYAKC